VNYSTTDQLFRGMIKHQVRMMRKFQSSDGFL